jgi:hypothetical protein
MNETGAQVWCKFGTSGEHLHSWGDRFVARRGGVVMTVRWEELTEQERVTLVALSQSPVLTLTVAVAARLEALGLAQPGFGGTVISAAGRELIWKRPAISSRRERRVR